MPTRTAAVALTALAALGLGTGCEKQSPYVTVTAGGVTVKARAVKYCRGNDCDETNDRPTIYVKEGDLLGVDVPRSVSDDGWRMGAEQAFTKKHYRTLEFPRGQYQPGQPLTLRVVRDPRHGVGEWQFTIVLKTE
jgi:hypothetical protein